MELKEIIERGGEVKSIASMEESFREMTIVFDQDLYLKIVNKLGNTLSKKLTTKKWGDQSLALLSLYNIVATGYHNIDWGNNRLPNKVELDLTIEGREDKMKKFFILASKELFKILEREKGKIVGADLGALSKNQSIHHIFTTWYIAVYQTREDQSIIEETLKDFTYFDYE